MAPSFPPRVRVQRAPLALCALVLSLPMAASAQPLGTAPAVPGAQDRQLFGTGAGGGGLGSNSSGLDINNPIDLINRIRRSTALDDATPPASAVDQALRELEGPAAGGKPAQPPSRPLPEGASQKFP